MASVAKPLTPQTFRIIVRAVSNRRDVANQDAAVGTEKPITPTHVPISTCALFKPM
jgi:hypothetical protein